MHTEGFLAPETAAEAREAYDGAGPAARVVVRETARAMGFDREEYRERVTGEVVEAARDALFASLLRVHVGSRGEFASWREAFEGRVHETGSEHVDRVVWHAAPFADAAVAATFQDERRAAVGTLRRQAFGRLYRDRLAAGSDDRGADGTGKDPGADGEEGTDPEAADDGEGDA